MSRRIALPIAGAVAALGSLALGSLAAAAQVTRVRSTRHFPHELLEVGTATVVLRADEETVRPGRYGVYWPGGRAVIGEVAAIAGGRVTRVLECVEVGELHPGKIAFGHLLAGDPRSALGLSFAEVTVPTDIGEVPLWELRGRDDAWVIVLHGYRGSRESALSFLPVLRSLDLSVLVVSYRNDHDAPPGRDRRYHLGASEWREVEAAVAFARANGAQRLVLFGWSMGAAIALQAYDRMDGRELVKGLLLDSPVLDWRAVLFHQAKTRRVPRTVMRLALRRVARVARLDYQDFDWVARAGEISVPVLIFHSSGDPTVPVEESRRLAEQRPDLVTLVDDEVAGHTGMFNVDPASYEAIVRTFLERVLGPSDACVASVAPPEGGATKRQGGPAIS